jgi:hypothetical protein
MTIPTAQTKSGGRLPNTIDSSNCRSSRGRIAQKEAHTKVFGRVGHKASNIQPPAGAQRLIYTADDRKGSQSPFEAYKVEETRWNSQSENTSDR